MSKYHCKCGGLILPDFDSFKVGDEVNCMLETRKPIGNGLVSINQKAFIGKIIDISGDEFSIKSKNKIYEFNRREFSPIDAPGPIEYFRIGKCRCELDQEKSNG
ncbi:hypothetical protein J671_1551 [Acinetobacter sp. 1130196]|uniref:hypothetical protein n=1 Tax=Acinetobacter calcoaceticus/baumannii complex TaxID=909768 RepID=UPI000446B985|nr:MULTISPECIES: hypothetical protein [Acinetobacter calcoaceticus/baumannii complex]EKU6035147.1 hypothetical protein [Acinetobacter nosocomialis]EXR18221.1 hypothetical protein J671_1551 [Acinetobacter sp. 1130196]OTL04421.1 hypothetical protein B9X83_05365 [Acinetobacter nosocomialis]OTU50208.1 hypothetical protein CAT56_03565 [Acinetobacter nosocomialis]